MTDAERQAALDDAIGDLRDKGLDPEAEALQYLMTGPTQGAADKLWMVLVAGLVGLLVVTVLGLIYVIVEDKSTDVIVTVFTGLLTGLLGLFVKSPVGESSQA